MQHNSCTHKEIRRKREEEQEEQEEQEEKEEEEEKKKKKIKVFDFWNQFKMSNSCLSQPKID